MKKEKKLPKNMRKCRGRKCDKIYNKYESEAERADLFCCVACEHGY